MLVGIRFQDDVVALIDQWRERQPDNPGRPEAVRQLLNVALALEARSERSSSFGDILQAPRLGGVLGRDGGLTSVAR